MNHGLSPEQIAARRLGVGGGDAKAIMAGEWVDLWRQKTGRAKEEDLSGVFAVQLGSYTEAFNCHWFEKVTGREVTMRNETIVHPALPYLRCNLDGFTVTSRGSPAVIDFKHVGAANEAMLLRYTPQLTHNAIVLAAHLGRPIDWWVLSVIQGNKWCDPWEQAIDPFYTEEYLAKAAEFWGYVERDEEPPEPEPVSAPKPQPKLRTVVIEGGEADADGVWTPPQGDKFQPWPNWGADFARHLASVIRTQPAATVNAIEREAIKALLPEDVGEVRRGDCAVKRDRTGAIRFTLPKKGEK